MIDFLFICGQILCLAGYLYGAYLVITHSDAFKPNDEKKREDFAPQSDPKEDLVWRKYLRSDW